MSDSLTFKNLTPHDNVAVRRKLALGEHTSGLVVTRQTVISVGLFKTDYFMEKILI